MNPRDYLIPEKMCSALLNGYVVFYDPGHPLAYAGNGVVYLHRHLGSVKVGRWLTSKDCVHHVDGDPCNNVLANLEVTNRSEHASGHHMRSRGPKKYVVCPQCGESFAVPRGPSGTRRTYCSKKCSALSQRCVERPSKDALSALLKDHNWCSLGRMFGVSDNAVRKWARSYGLL